MAPVRTVLDVLLLADRIAHPMKLRALLCGFKTNRDLAQAAGLSDSRVSEIFASKGRPALLDEKEAIAKCVGSSAHAWPDRALDAAKSIQAGDVLKGLPDETVRVVLAAEILKRVCAAIGMSAAEQEQALAQFTDAAVEKLRR
jgi:protein-disulfide isomerase-like protein with CxxC motif